MSRKILTMLRFGFFCLAFFLSAEGFAQRYSYTSGNLSVDITVLNPCSGSNGAIVFKINSTEGGADANIAIIGPPNLFPGQNVPMGSTFTFNTTKTLPANSYQWILGDGTNVIGSAVDAALYPKFTLTTITSPSITKDLEVNNTSCSVLNGQVQGSITGGSKALPGGGSFTYTWKQGATTLVTGTTDGNSPLNLATLLGVGGLAGGTYVLTVNDDFSQCSATQSFTITDPSPIAFNVTTSSPLAICQGSNITLSLNNSENTPVTYEIVQNGTPTGITFPGTAASPFVMNFSSATFANNDILQVRATNGFCSPVVMNGSVTLQISLPATANAGAPQTLCAGTIGTLSGSSVGGSATTGAWSIVSQPGGGDGLLSSTAQTSTPSTVTFTATVAGSYTLQLTSDDPVGPCPAATSQVVITVNALPTVAAGADNAICSSDIYPLAGSSIGGAASTGAWSIVTQPGGGDGLLSNTAQTATPSTVTFTATVAGAYTLRLTTNDPAGPCAAVTDDVVITVNPGATAAAGIDKTICGGGTSTLAGASVGGAATTGAWSIVSQPVGGDGALSNTAQTATPATVTFTATVPGVYLLQLTSNDPAGPCPAATDQVQVTVNQPATVDAGANNTICGGDVYSLAGATVGGSATTGAWSFVTQPVGGNGVLSSIVQTATPAAVTFTATVAGTYRLRLRTNDPAGPCGSVFDDVFITVNLAPTAAAGTDNAICSGTTATLSGSSVGGSATTGAWSIVSQPGGGDGLLSSTAQTATPATVTFTATVAGTYTLQLTSNDPAGPCPAATDQVVITVNPLPTVAAGADNTICAADIYTLAGSSIGGAASTGTWSIVTQPVGGDGLLSNTAATATPASVTFTATVVGSYTLRLTTDDPTGPCSAVSDDVVITVNPGATANAGTDNTICSADVYTLAGATVGGSATTGAWSIVSQPGGGNGLLSSTAQTATPATVTFTATVAGTYTLQLTSNDPAGPCPAATDQVIITVNAQPTAAAGSDNTICTADIYPLAGSSIGGAASTGTWSIVTQPVGGDGLLSNTAATATPSTVTFTATVAGSYTLRLTTNDPAGPCVAVSDDVVITVNPGATAAAGVDNAICASDIYTLTGSSVGGAATTGAWSIASQPVGGDGLLSSTAQTATPATVTFTGTVAGTYTLQLTSNDPAGPCPAATDQVVITVAPQATAAAGSDNTICAADVYPLAGSSVGGSATTGAWSIVTQPGGGDGTLSSTAQTATPATVTFKATVAGVYTLRLTTNDPAGSCTPTSDDVLITVNPGATAAAGADNTICAADVYALTGATVGGSATTGAWSIVSQPGGGNGVLSSTAQTATPATVTFTATVAGAYTLQLTSNDPAGPCPAANDQVIITVAPPATVAAGADNATCGGSPYTLTGSSVGGSATTGAWSIVTQPGGGDGSLSSTAQTATPATVTFTATVAGAYTLRLTTNDPAGSCVAVSDDVVITVNPGATAAAGADNAICAADVYTLAGANVGGSATTGAWSVVSQPVGGDGALSSTAQTATPATVTFTATVAGTYTLQLTSNDPAGPCPAATDQVVITVSPQATAAAGADNTVCSPAAYTLAGSSVGGSAITGAWSIVTQPGGGDGALSSTAQTATPSTVSFTATVAGAYTLRLTTNDPAGSCTSVTDDVIITVNPGATAAAGADNSICAADVYTLAGSSVGGSATTGAWSIVTQPIGGDGSLSSTVQTATPATVTFTATVAGTYTLQLTSEDPAGPCVAATDQVVITVTPAPNAGSDGSTSVCNSETAFNLLSVLGGTPNAGGSWVDMDGSGAVIAGNNANFTTVGAGTYHFQYVVTGSGSCANATAIATVAVSDSKSAGNDNAATACNADTAFDLFAHLLGSPDNGGTWFDVNSSGGVITGNTVDLTGVPVGSYIFRYIVTSAAPCVSDTSFVTVDVISTAPNAGSDNSVTACNSNNAFNLFNSLGGTPNPGGTWTDMNASGAVITGNLADLTAVAAGTYQYQYTITVAGCGSASSIVTVTVTDGPNAGTDGAASSCSSNTAFNLFAALGGTPDVGGTWVDADGSGAIITGNNADLSPITTSNTYHFQYVVTGTGPCVNDTATVSLTISLPANAGNDATVPACNADVAFDLTAHLGGTPDAGGAWTDLDGSGAVITGSIADLTPVAPGTYHYQYTVTGAALCGTDVATLTVNVSAPPNAGTDATASACSSETAFDLFAKLGGTPGAGGTWVDKDASGAVITGNLANLTSVAPGTYDFQYVLKGAPCANDTATVALTINAAPNAGVDRSATACTTNAAFDLRAALGGTPDNGGSWTDLDGSGGVITGNTIDLTTVAVGTYKFRYIVLGSGLCANDTSVVTLKVINTTPDAGSDNTVAACNSETAFDLFASLGGTPDPGGVWTDVDASGAVITNDLINLTTLAAGTYHYRYDLNVSGCGSASAVVTINVTDGPDAGGDKAITLCGVTAPVDLFANLAGTPDAGGSWVDVDASGAIITGNNADLSSVALGTYRFQYVVTGTAPCVNDTSTLTINLVAPPNAGTDTTGVACNSATAFDLYASLGGTPDVGGSWIDADASGAVITGNAANFTAVTTAGVYHFKYVVTGTGPCANDTSTVALTINLPPNAGNDASAAACNSDTAFDLFAKLTGTPATGGVWVDADASGAAITGNIADFTGVPAGTYDFQYVVTATAPCVNDTATVTVTISNGPSVANAGPDQVLCGGVFTTNLAATPVTSGTGNWVIMSGTGGLVTTPTSPTSSFIGAVGQAYALRWIVTAGSCSPSIDTVVVNFSASPATTTPITICVNNAAPTLTATAAGATGFKWYLGTGPSRTLLATTVTGSFTPGAELNRTAPGSVTYEVTAVYACGESPGSQIVVNVSNTGGCSGGTGNCATVVIRPNTVPAKCTLSTGGVTFTINPLVPAVNNVGVIIKIDRVKDFPTDPVVTYTNKNDTTFLNRLPAGNYTYSIVYGDSSCINPGTFVIDKSGTVGTPIASNIINPVCAGSATGSVMIDVPGETGNVLEWSYDGGITDPFKPFVAGTQVTGIPAGAAPTFQQVISVRRNSADPCYAEVTIVMQDQHPPITVTFETSDATCAGNDGKVFNVAATGGDGGPFQFALGTGAFQSSNTFNNVSGGSYYLKAKDATGCVDSANVDVVFPGFVGFTVTPDDADCSNNGLSGSLSIQFALAGTYQAGLSVDPLVEPTSYTQYSTSDPVNDVPLTFNNLSRGNYYVFAKTSSSECPTRRGPFFIDGVAAISFNIAQICVNNQVSLSLQNVTGDYTSGNPVTITVYDVLGQAVETFAVAIDPQIPINYADHNFLHTPGEYRIQLTQLSDVGFCNVQSDRVTYVVKQPLTAIVESLKQSYPDIPTGEMALLFTGGTAPYEVRINLEQATGEILSYVTDWEEVQKNSDLQFEKVYEKIPPGEYKVEIQDSIGCFIQIDPNPIIDRDKAIYIPNIFTPNDDGYNDAFHIRNLPDGSKLSISNRWGKEVYSSSNYQNTWDGKGVEDGIYFYRLTPSEGDALSGWVEVLRGVKP